MIQAVKGEADSHGIAVFLGIGSNLQGPQQQVNHGFSELQQLPECRDMLCSPLYLGPPMGAPGQPDYVNAVVSLVTTLAPHRLLQEVQAIEQAQGRVRKARWGARTLDIDLLLYGDMTLDTPDLQIPHPGIAQRAFVLYPLRDLAPDLTIPGVGKVVDLAAAVNAEGLVRIGRSH